MDSDIKIIPAELVHLEPIIKLLSDDPLGSQREEYVLPLPDSYLNAFNRISNDPSHHLMVLRQGEQVCGTFQLSIIPYLTYKGGKRAQLEAVRIRKDLRGQGLGKKIIDWCVERAKVEEAHVLQLTTDKKRTDSIHFYESMGFISTHEGMKMHL